EDHRMEMELQNEFHSIGLAPAVLGFDSDSKVSLIVMEPVDGTLAELLCSVDNPENVIDQVVNMMKVMEQYGVTHGDMHSGNITYQLPPDGSAKLMLIDYGFSSTRTHDPALDAEQLFSELVEIEESPFAEAFQQGLQAYLNTTPSARLYTLTGDRDRWQNLFDDYQDLIGLRDTPLVPRPQKRQRDDDEDEKEEEEPMMAALAVDMEEEEDQDQDSHIAQVLQDVVQEVNPESRAAVSSAVQMVSQGIQDPAARGKMIGRLRALVPYVPPIVGYPILGAAQAMEFAMQRQAMVQLSPVEFVQMAIQGIRELRGTLDLSTMSQVYDSLTLTGVPCDFDDITVLSNMQRLGVSVDQLMPMILKINEVVIQLTRPDVNYNQTIFELANAFFVEVFAGLIPTLNELCQALAQEHPSPRKVNSIMRKLAEHNQTINQIAGEHGGNWGLLGAIQASVDNAFTPVNWLLRQGYRFLRQHVWAALGTFMHQGHFVYQMTFDTAQMLLGMMSVGQTWLNRFYNFFDPTVGWLPRVFGRVGSQASLMTRGRMIFMNAFVNQLNNVITYFGVPTWLGYGLIFLTLDWSVSWLTQVLKYLAKVVVKEALAPSLPALESDMKWLCTADEQCIPVTSQICEEQVGLVTRKRARIPQYKCYATEANCRRLCK
ncbi:MAG: hypothetical protein K0U52_13235, partial [Gammaproteobacteria bacterium]|nr:hypothetical protein [Gammaproteobacteria bacterium]